MTKFQGVLNAFNQLLSILYMCTEVPYLGIEYVTKAVFAHKLVRENSSALFESVVEAV